MEIKASLKKPFSQEDRINFVIGQNHKNGYEIKETETALEAWGRTTEEMIALEKQKHKAELLAQLDQYDLKSIRPLRAMSAGVGTREDKNQLEALEAQVALLREQLKELSVEEALI